MYRKHTDRSSKRTFGAAKLTVRAAVVIAGVVGVSAVMSEGSQLLNASEEQSSAVLDTSVEEPQTPSDALVTETVTTEEQIPFQKQTEEDPTIPVGTSYQKTVGSPGTIVRTYRVTRLNGEETQRLLVDEVVKTRPSIEVTVIGTLGQR